MLIEPVNSEIAIVRQCDLIDLARSSWYYHPRRDNAYNEELMRLIDEEYTKHPFRGIGQLTDWLHTEGHLVNHKRVERLMRKMGIQAIYPKRHLSASNPSHRIYPYLLRDMFITQPNQVWATDITYIRMHPGWLYLVAIMDWYSRYVVSWELSNTLDVEFCLTALDRALTKKQPGIFNSDQGSQFTSADFTERLESSGIRISMDGRGRVYDNIYIERLWRSVKYEEVYIHDYQTVSEAKSLLGTYFQFYNEERGHTALGKKTPAEIYFGPTTH
jgi:putative transposase